MTLKQILQKTTSQTIQAALLQQRIANPGRNETELRKAVADQLGITRQTVYRHAPATVRKVSA